MSKEAITSKIKHAIKHRTSPAKKTCTTVAALTPSLAASKNKMLMWAATVVQQLCKSCRTCFKFYCMFYFTCDRSLIHSQQWYGSSSIDYNLISSNWSTVFSSTCIWNSNTRQSQPWSTVLVVTVTLNKRRTRGGCFRFRFVGILLPVFSGRRGRISRWGSSLCDSLAVIRDRRLSVGFLGRRRNTRLLSLVGATVASFWVRWRHLVTWLVVVNAGSRAVLCRKFLVVGVGFDFRYFVRCLLARGRCKNKPDVVDFLAEFYRK